MEAAISDKKELAEKVAGMLGWTLLEMPDRLMIYKLMDGVSYEIFSWPTVGLCIEKALEMGWNLRTTICGNYLKFVKPDGQYTGLYSIEGYGLIVARLRAFADIPMEGTSGNQ